MLDQNKIDGITKKLLNPTLFRFTLFNILPMGYLSKMKITQLNEELCEVKVPFNRRNKNPFKSTFWAVLGMAAEMSSGALVIRYTFNQKPSIATIILEQTGTFHKKAVGTTTFICKNGQEIKNAVLKTLETKEAVTVKCEMEGRSESGELVAEFSFTWSFKARD